MSKFFLRLVDIPELSFLWQLDDLVLKFWLVVDVHLDFIQQLIRVINVFDANWLINLDCVTGGEWFTHMLVDFTDDA